MALTILKKQGASMPNHIQNKLQFKGTKEQVRAIKLFIRSDEIEKGHPRARMDFNKIIPSHPDLDISSPPHTEAEKAKAMENIKKYGAPTWYEWACQNWGTKWNAYSTPDKRDRVDTIYFQTAWSLPFPVILALSKKFPAVTIIVSYADEDIGSNLGKFSIKNGVEIELIDFSGSSSEAEAKRNKFAMELQHPEICKDPAALKEWGFNKNFERVNED